MSFKTTLLPEYTDTIVYQKESFYKNASNLLDVFGEYLNELNLNLDYEKGKSSGDIIKNNVLFFEKLNENDFVIEGKEIDIIFKDYYIEKYNSLFTSLKSSVSSFVKNNVYFKQYSDDVGILTDSNSTLDCSIAPYYDIFYSDIDVPNNLNSTIYNKLTNNNKLMQIKFSKFNDGMMKNNLKGLVNYDNVNISKTSHGKDLVTDYYYYDRLFKFKEPLTQNISSILQGLGDYILFIKNLNKRENNEKSSLLAFNAKVEDVENVIDILKNKITSNPYTSNSILSS
mgnify:FL=1|tara:strand:- start:719 stop:1570 length:852 start_codon:yes stop_codon:yes gene_type:complete